MNQLHRAKNTISAENEPTTGATIRNFRIVQLEGGGAQRTIA